ncbi:hypothetical protein [Mesoterricola silvestris]|uniref:Uncharacterized protein n=1 Tax=Mesoterricola silvestris TaxID=2927979 RepID=A0AA48K976_9BACT|nr:hypothetical protein [Mesoterricola silvestris]BDU72037.1 hypothetical protein METEAL_12110 [Mesoterricola silvestris]
MRSCLPFALATVMAFGQDAPPPLGTGAARPVDLDLRAAPVATLVTGDTRDVAGTEAARRAWQTYLEPLAGAGSLRILLPPGAERVRMLLAASQAAKARFPGLRLFVAYQEGAAPILDEDAWGAVDGGALVPADLGGDPGRWPTILAAAQAQFPGRPWTLWAPVDPGPLAGQLLGDGGRLEVPAGTPSAQLAQSLPRGRADMEGGFGDITLRPRGAGPVLRWVYRKEAWRPAPVPADRNEVQVVDREAYDVGALLSRVRATAARNLAAVRSAWSAVTVDLHFQGEGGSADLGYLFEGFEKAGEPEELLRKELRFNGVKANVGGGAQFPVIEARTSLAAPVALALTERYRYADGGPAGPGRRILRFAPVDRDPLLYTGELTVEEASGRILEERSRRSGLPGIVRSEDRVITYGEMAPGIWRIARIHTAERWVATGGVSQVLRDIAYSACRFNDPAFDGARAAARDGKGSLLQNTREGYRYLVKQADGSRALETRASSRAKAVGGVVLVVPGMEPPVMPLAGLLMFDFNALDRGIQYSLLTAGVWNSLNLTVSKALLGLDLTSQAVLTLFGGTERPVKDGRQEDKEGVDRRSQLVELGLGRDLGAGFRLEALGNFTHDLFSTPKDKYRTPGFLNPPSGWTLLGSAQLTWQHKGFQIRSKYGEGRRPQGDFGAPGAVQPLPGEGRFTRWEGAAGYDVEPAKGVWLNSEVGFGGGRFFDRFSPLSFDGRVSGIKPYAVVADRMVYGGVSLAFPTGPNLRLTLGLNHGRAHSLTDQKTYGFTGLKIAGDLPGFWWFTTIRVDLGAGLHSDVKGVRTVNGMISFLHLY